jgi:hypothetical protein
MTYYIFERKSAGPTGWSAHVRCQFATEKKAVEYMNANYSPVNEGDDNKDWTRVDDNGQTVEAVILFQKRKS